MTVTLTSACGFSAEDYALQYAEQTTVKCPSFFQFLRIFVDMQMISSSILIFFVGNSDVRTDRGLLTPFGRSVANKIFFSSRSMLVLAPNSSGKLSQRTL